jgi:CheY-like chemotaxis protein
MKRTKNSVDDFEQPLRDALTHFYDPSYEPPEHLLKMLGLQAEQGSEVLWRLLTKAIEGLKPSPDVPATSHVWRLYNILVCRYTKDMTQEETAERLGISPRHLRREQQLAVEVLARRLLEQKSATDDEPKAGEAVLATSWHSQLRQELASLQKNSPGAVSNVKEVVLKVAQRSQVAASYQNVVLELEHVQPHLTVTLHPSVLQQILVEVIESFMDHHTGGQLKFQAQQQGQNVILTVSGFLAKDVKLPVSDFVKEILDAEGGSARTHVNDQQGFFELILPSARQITVLVVDDNQDLVHFYKRYTANTKYQLHHVSEGHHVLEKLLTLSPHIVVLDVMLPDTDGWELLAQLQRHAVARSIPVIVCSVIKGEEFASVLGATRFLAKPVSRQQFLEALEQVLHGAPQ